MRLVFRADASREIGAGHVMRSSTLAEEAIARGMDCIFVGDLGGIDWLELRIRSLGFSQIFLPGSNFEPLNNLDVLILDSYTIVPDDAFIQQKRWLNVVCISDEFTPTYRCDLIVHPGLDVNWLPTADIPVLSGPNHILLRKSIKKVPLSMVDGSLGPKVLVVGGGTDPYGFCNEIAAILDRIDDTFHVEFFSSEEIKSKTGKKFRTHPVGASLDLHVDAAQVVITTASTSSLEFIAREIPTGVACLVENQEGFYQHLGEIGVVAQIGTRDSSGLWKLNFESIKTLILSVELQKKLRGNCKNLVDLDGSKRVIDYIIKLILKK